MKKSILAAAVAATGASLLMSGGAMAFDSVNWQGGAEKAYHQTQATGPDIGSIGCIAGTCTDPDFGGPGDNGEFSSHIIITNKTLGGPLAAYTPTVDCYTYTEADYIFDASGNAIADGSSANISDMTKILRTNNDNYVPGLIPAYAGAGFQNTGNVDAIPTRANLCTDAEGKITGGTYGFFATGITGINSYVISDWDARVAAAFQGGTAGVSVPFGNLPTTAAAQAAIATYKSGTAQGPGPYVGPGFDAGAGDTPWGLVALIDIAYTTCDTVTECGQFGKSVPVPAFAAASLGLGLLGITYLTGRRRTIK